MLKAATATTAAMAGTITHFQKKGLRPAVVLGDPLKDFCRDDCLPAGLASTAAAALVAAAFIICRAVFFCQSADELCRLASAACSSALKSSEKSSVKIRSRGPQWSQLAA